MSERKRTSVAGVAYTGGPLKLSGWKAPVVVDLSGLCIPESVPLLANHDVRTSSRVGIVRATIQGHNLHVEGEVLSEGPEARDIVAQAKSGGPWQLSIGADAQRSELVQGERTVNGRVQHGPFFHVRQSVLREVSVVAVGADASSTMKLAASWALSPAPADAQAPEADGAVSAAAEHARMDAVDAAIESAVRQSGGHIDQQTLADIRAAAALRGWSPEAAALHVVRALRPAVGITKPNIAASRSIGESCSPDVLAAATMLHVGQSELAEASYGADACQRADDLKLGSLMDLARACLEAERVDVPRGTNELVRAAFSTASLPQTLSDVAHKVLLRAYDTAPDSWRSFVTVKSVSDFKPTRALRPVWRGELEEVAPDGELKHGSIEEEYYQFQASTFGKVFSLSRKQMIDDDAGALSTCAEALGRMAANTLSNKVWEAILGNATMPDGYAFFSTDHANDVAGALDADALQSAITSMRTQRADGVDLDIMPKVLAVPPELEWTARGLLESTNLVAVGVGNSAATAPAGNVLAKAVALAVEPRISNTRFTGASEDAWFMFGGPADGAVVVAYLNGATRPTVEYFGLESNANVLALTWRCYFDFAVGLGDHRPACRGGVAE